MTRIVNCLANYTDANYPVHFAVNSIEIVDGRVLDAVSCEVVDGKVLEIVGLPVVKLFLREHVVVHVVGYT